MTCGRCGSNRLFQFEADPTTSKRAVNPGSFPLVCRSCGQLTVDGVVLRVPAELELQAKNLAEEALKAGTEAVTLLANDPNARVERYFSKVYKEAYLDGFLRCLAFYHHNMKEGRLKRLRELWLKNRFQGADDGKKVCIEIDRLTYNEFDQLMTLGPVPD